MRRLKSWYVKCIYLFLVDCLRRPGRLKYDNAYRHYRQLICFMSFIWLGFDAVDQHCGRRKPGSACPEETNHHPQVVDGLSTYDRKDYQLLYPTLTLLIQYPVFYILYNVQITEVFIGRYTRVLKNGLCWHKFNGVKFHLQPKIHAYFRLRKK